MEALALKPIDRGLEELSIAGQLLARLLTTARKDHSGEIVGAEVLIDESLDDFARRCSSA